MPDDPKWIADAREALRPEIGALAYVVVYEALESVGVKPNEMSVKKIVPFLCKLKDHLPADVDRDALTSRVGRIALDSLTSAAYHK